jgi:hypothetical protein
MDINEIVNSSASAFIHSTLFGVVIVDKEYNIVWHNEKFANDYTAGVNVVGIKCYESLGSDIPHKICPTKATLTNKSFSRQLLDQDNNYFVSMSFPVGNDFAAHIYTSFDKDKINIEEIYK